MATKDERQGTGLALIDDALTEAQEGQATDSQAQRMAQGEVENAIELDGYYNVLDIAKGSLDPTTLSREELMIAMHEAHHLDSKVSENGFSFMDANGEPDYTAFHEYLQDESNYQDALDQIDAMTSRPDFSEKKAEDMKRTLADFRSKDVGRFEGYGWQDMPLFIKYGDNPINFVKGRTSVYTNFMAELEAHADESPAIAETIRQFREAEDGGQYDKKQFAKDSNRIISDRARASVESGELPIDETRLDERTGIAKMGSGIHQMLSTFTGNFAYDEVEDMKDKAYLDYVHDMDYALSDWEAAYVKRESTEIDDRVNNWLDGLATTIEGTGETVEGAADAVDGIIGNVGNFLGSLDLSKAGPWVALGAGVLGGSLLFGGGGDGIGGSLVKVAAIAAIAFVGYKALSQDSEQPTEGHAEKATKEAKDAQADGLTPTATNSKESAVMQGFDGLAKRAEQAVTAAAEPMADATAQTQERMMTT